MCYPHLPQDAAQRCECWFKKTWTIVRSINHRIQPLFSGNLAILGAPSCIFISVCTVNISQDYPTINHKLVVDIFLYLMFPYFLMAISLMCLLLNLLINNYMVSTPFNSMILLSIIIVVDSKSNYIPLSL